ncbi:MAG: hypothetical protein M4579_002925 [Chaenotheca gracillima]|nr:MAG: hypothetical protein M4579_002925 [Chaenotheca gracillima]
MPGGVQQWTSKPYYNTYVSPYGPKYTINRNLHGVTGFTLKRYFFTLGGFGAVGGIFALFFFSGIPRVQRDILQPLPVIGDHFLQETPAEDNVSLK